MSSRLSHLRCSRCGAEQTADRLVNRCICGGTLQAQYDLASVEWAAPAARRHGLWRYRELLPVSGAPLSLGEPETPLLSLPRLSQRWGTEVYLKDDAGLPGATFKARGACVALARARELGARSVVLPSAGNAGGAWALYGARAGMDVTVTMAATAPEVNKAEVTLAGGRLELVEGTIADAGRRAAEISAATGAFLAATFSEPYRVEGKKTCWLEVFEQLAGLASSGSQTLRFPATIVTSVGGGVALVAAAKAAREIGELHDAGAPARLVGVQAAACAPITRAFEDGAPEPEPWRGDFDTVAWGLKVPAPSEGALVLEEVRSSGGVMMAAGENDMLSAMRDLASTEGVWACPEGAATIWAAGRLAAQGRLEGPVVLYNTAAGAKYGNVLTGGS